MKISIITPTYNRKHLLQETVESVKKSLLIPYEDVSWEYIIYDDGSTDGTPELFQKEQHPNIRYIRNDNNQGQSKARNEAVKEARGEYLFFLDSDDILLQRTLYKFAAKAKEFPGAGWFVADFLHVDENLRYIIGDDYYSWNFKDIGNMLDSIFKGEHYIQQNIFIKKSLFINVGMFDPSVKMGEDLDLCVRVLLKGHMPHICDFISHLHRVHSSNMSGAVTKDMHVKSALELKKKYQS
ncbi:MAG: glycosyltransferase [Candidatus Parcubacteria bacterium]|nr:glycosyltransferase [Candidatus Parcubacteria bacterium]